MTCWLLLILFDLLVVWGFTIYDRKHPSNGTSGNLGMAILLAFCLGFMNIIFGIVQFALWVVS